MAASKKTATKSVAKVQEVGSQANSLSKSDIQKWAKNLVVFFAPAGIIFLLALQNGAELKEALLPVYSWMLGSLIDLLKKFKSDTTV
jgi:hypothetical protein